MAAKAAAIEAVEQSLSMEEDDDDILNSGFVQLNIGDQSPMVRAGQAQRDPYDSSIVDEWSYTPNTKHKYAYHVVGPLQTSSLVQEGVRALEVHRCLICSIARIAPGSCQRYLRKICTAHLRCNICQPVVGCCVLSTGARGSSRTLTDCVPDDMLLLIFDPRGDLPSAIQEAEDKLASLRRRLEQGLPPDTPQEQADKRRMLMQQQQRERPSKPAR